MNPTIVTASTTAYVTIANLSILSLFTDDLSLIEIKRPRLELNQHPRVECNYNYV